MHASLNVVQCLRILFEKVAKAQDQSKYVKALEEEVARLKQSNYKYTKSEEKLIHDNINLKKRVNEVDRDLSKVWNEH